MNPHATDREESVAGSLNSEKTTGSDAKYSAKKLQCYKQKKPAVTFRWIWHVKNSGNIVYREGAE